jgi:hypothetical protein
VKNTVYRIQDVCHLIKGEYPTLKTPPGEYPLVVTAAFRRSASTYQIDGKAVCVPLISSTGHGHAALHRVHYEEGKFAVADLLVALVVKDENICLPKYLYYLLSARKNEYFVTLMKGSANVSLKSKDIAKVEICLPPLSEQKRIVARIDKLAAKIEEAHSLRYQAAEEAEVLSASWLNSTFSKLAPRTGRPLGDVAEIIGGGSLPDTTLAEGGAAEVLLVKVSDMNRPGNEVLRSYFYTVFVRFRIFLSRRRRIRTFLTRTCAFCSTPLYPNPLNSTKTLLIEVDK